MNEAIPSDPRDGLFEGSWEKAVKTLLHTVDYMDHG